MDPAVEFTTKVTKCTKNKGIRAMRLHGELTPLVNPILTNSLDSSLSIPNIFFVLFVFFVVKTTGFKIIPGREP